jgi:hypothetical protein
MTTATSVLHASINEPIEQAKLSVVGTGQLTWFGLTVYDATLYSPEGAYHPEHPHAIQITYRFNFSREQLARKSLEEIERIHGRQPNRMVMLQQLKSVFRDVTEGDHILGIHHPGERAEFYSNDVLLGRIEDAALAAAFFSIWLDPATREPDLPAGMLGFRQ